MKHLLTSLVCASALFAVPATSQDTIADLVVAASGGATAGQFDDESRDYDILLNALQTASLVGAVADPNASLTVFAPNDAAFGRLAADLGFAGGTEAETWTFLVDALTQLGNGDPIPVLTAVLTYHVAPEELSPFAIIRKSIFRRTIATLQGATIRPFFFFLVDNDPDLRNPLFQWPINLRASNGRIHTISRVLLPIDV